jgi:putative transposase
MSDSEWHVLRLYSRGPPRRGPKRKWCIRQVFSPIFYLLKTGCQWRNLPKDFPLWQTVFYRFRRWQRRSVWFRAHEALRRATRVKAGRHSDPSAAIIDSQSVKTTAEAAWFSGFDDNKRSRAQKALLVDTPGLLLWIYTTPTNVGERRAAKGCVAGMTFALPRLNTIWADGGYTGDDLAQACAGNGWNLIIVKRPQGHFEVQPKRWIVERALAWLQNSRRLVVDYEPQPQTGESLIEMAMIRLMLKRLAVSGSVDG